MISSGCSAQNKGPRQEGVPLILTSLPVLQSPALQGFLSQDVYSPSGPALEPVPQPAFFESGLEYRYSVKLGSRVRFILCLWRWQRLIPQGGRHGFLKLQTLPLSHLPASLGERLPASSWRLGQLPLPHHLPHGIAGATQPEDSQRRSHNPNQRTPGLCLQLPGHLHLGEHKRWTYVVNGDFWVGSG